MSEQVEAFISEHALLQRGGIDYLTLDVARQVVEYCQQNHCAILGIDGFRDFGDGRIMATLDLIADCSPPQNPAERQSWPDFQQTVNSFALEFISKLKKVEEDEDIRVLVEILVQEPY